MIGWSDSCNDTMTPRRPSRRGPAREERTVSENNEPVAKFDATVQPFVDFWSSYIAQANDATRKLVEDFDGSADVKTWQRRWFETVSRSLDAYMRSPVFLQAMRENTHLLVKAKQQTDDLSAEFARNANIPTATDISGLFERLHSVEDAVLSRLEQIEQRLARIEQQTGVSQETHA